MPKHFLSLKDFSTKEIIHLIDSTLSIKKNVMAGKLDPFLAQKSLTLLFTKPSTRTRVSSETGWAAYGGHTMFLGKNDIQLGSGEPLSVTAKVISSMTDCILARLGSHSEILTVAKHSSVPVINALTAKFHPLQILADLTTIREIYGQEKIKVAWVGDSNNILNSMLVTYPRLGYSLSVATPAAYPVDVNIIPKNSGEDLVKIFKDPVDACQGAQVIMTDTWISMGEESDTAKIQAFAGFQVTENLARKAKPDWKFMHCLPRKQWEVDDQVFEGNRSVIFRQAENRKYSVMAVFEFLMKQID